MWLRTAKLLNTYNEELTKQTDPYKYYLNRIKASDDTTDKGEHENVPFICIDEIKKVSEDDSEIRYEYRDYLIVESKKGYSDSKEKEKLLTNAYKLNADLIYGDYDHVNKNGERHTPFYKPDYSYNTFENHDLYSEFYAVKKEKEHVGLKGMARVEHVPEVLFHWCCEKDYEEITELHNLNNIRYKTDDFYLSDEETGKVKDCVSIIIPSKDNPELIGTCIDGIKRAKIKSGINRLEVIVVDNGSTVINKEEITGVIENNADFALFSEGETGVINEDSSSDNVKGLIIKYLYKTADFNFSDMCNMGVANSTGSFLLFMNDDIEVTDDLFILKLLCLARKENIGAVGCKLLYPGEEKRIQHTGITCLKYAGPTHKLSTFPDDKVYYFGKNKGVHDYLAVTGACLMVERDKYFKTGGFYGKMKVGYNDVDLCLSLYESGFWNVVNNDCVLVHHESISRGSDAASERKLERLDKEREMLYERHPWIVEKGDLFYNPNLAEDFLDYRVNVIPDFEKRDFVSCEIEKPVSKFAGIIDGPLISEHVLSGHSKNMFMNVESISRNRDYVEIKGWALINKRDNSKFESYITLTGTDGNCRVFSTAKVYRQDLGTVFPEAKNVELSGFMARVSARDYYGIEDTNNRENIEAENTEAAIGVLIINKQTGKKHYAGYNKSDI